MLFIRCFKLICTARVIDLSDVTYIIQYCTLRSWYMRKRINHWYSVVPEKSQPSGPPFSRKLGSLVSHWNKGPRDGIFLSPLNINDEFYLSRISYAYLTWVAMWDRFFRQQAYIGSTRSCMYWYVRKYFYLRLKSQMSLSGVQEKVFLTGKAFITLKN